MKNRKLKIVSLILVLISLYLSFNVMPVFASTTGADANGFTWQSDNGVTYSITGYTGSATNITIPSSIDGHTVTSIGSNAFKNKPLTSVTIPNTVTSIGGFAFYYCSSLVSISIPNSVTSIGDSAFAYCISLPNITLPINLSSIGNSTFQDCKAFTGITIPNSVTSIGTYAFLECNSLTNITIPSSVTHIGEGAFKDCKALRSAVMPDSVTSIGNYLFYNCQLLSSVRLSNNLTNTGDFIFYNCFSLTGVTLPKSLTNIGNSAFENCTALTYITIPNGVTRIGYRAFVMCKVLANITIPSAVKIIDFNAFAHCYAFTNIIIPDSVTSIGDYAFYYCTSLKEVTIPRSVTSIGFLTFSSCNSNFKMKGFEGSYAQVYAGSNSITFEGLPTTDNNNSLPPIPPTQTTPTQSQTTQTPPEQSQTTQSQTTQTPTEQSQTTQSQTTQTPPEQSQTTQTPTTQSQTPSSNDTKTTSSNNGPSAKAVSSVSVSPNAICLAIGHKQSLVTTVLPTDASDQTVTWSSSNENVATVDSAGTVTAKAIGVTNITALVGTKTAISIVTVADNIVTLNESNKKLSISADKSVLNGASKFSVTDIANKESGLDSQYSSRYSVVYCFDAKLEDINGKVVEPTANILVSIPLTPSMLKNASDYLVIYIDNSGVAHEIQTTVDGNNLVFATNHFSRYAVVIANKTDSLANKAVTPNKGNNLNVSLITAFILCVVIVIFIFLKKRSIISK